MKKPLAAAAIGAAIALGSLFGAGTASAGSSTFIDELNYHGWYDGAPGSLLNQGYRTCELLNSGWPVNDVIADVYHRADNTVGWSKAREFVALAADYLC